MYYIPVFAAKDLVLRLMASVELALSALLKITNKWTTMLIRIIQGDYLSLAAPTTRYQNIDEWQCH